jgi:hypothetical protein
MTVLSFAFYFLIAFAPLLLVIGMTTSSDPEHLSLGSLLLPALLCMYSAGLWGHFIADWKGGQEEAKREVLLQRESRSLSLLSRTLLSVVSAHPNAQREKEPNILVLGDIPMLVVRDGTGKRVAVGEQNGQILVSVEGEDDVLL